MLPTGIETNHGSIVKFKGQCTLFITQAIIRGGAIFVVDPLIINNDGTLELVQPTWRRNPIDKKEIIQ